MYCRNPDPNAETTAAATVETPQQRRFHSGWWFRSKVRRGQDENHPQYDPVHSSRLPRRHVVALTYHQEQGTTTPRTAELDDVIFTAPLSFSLVEHLYFIFTFFREIDVAPAIELFNLHRI